MYFQSLDHKRLYDEYSIGERDHDAMIYIMTSHLMVSEFFKFYDHKTKKLKDFDISILTSTEKRLARLAKHLFLDYECPSIADTLVFADYENKLLVIQALCLYCDVKPSELLK